MSILKAIKAWWKPEVKEASTKATVRFKNGAAINLYTPAHASDEMKIKVAGFVTVNRDLEKEARVRAMLMNMQNDQSRQTGLRGQSYAGNMLMGSAAQRSALSGQTEGWRAVW